MTNKKSATLQLHVGSFKLQGCCKNMGTLQPAQKSSTGMQRVVLKLYKPVVIILVVSSAAAAVSTAATVCLSPFFVSHLVRS